MRIRYDLRACGSFILDRNPYGVPTLHPMTVPAGNYRTGSVDAFLQGSLPPIIKELLDPIFQAAGEAASPWFDAQGNLIEEKRKQMPPGLAKHLD